MSRKNEIDRKNLWILPATIIVAVLIPITTVLAQAPTRIYFARGATRATAHGYLRGLRDEASFVLRAKAGQHMRVDIRAQGATRGMVTFPSGRQEGAPGGVVFDGQIDETGDYHIRVTESSMANAWRGNFTLIVDIVSSNSQAEAPGNQRLARYEGKYPSELFRNEPALKTRLRSLLGSSYKTFFDRLQTEMPIKNDEGFLIVEGCMAHQCTIEVAVLAIDLERNQLHVAIKSTNYNGRYKLWNENGSEVPAALRRAMQEAAP